MISATRLTDPMVRTIVALLLTAASLAMGSWVGVALLSVLGIFWCFVFYVNRIHPELEAAPNGFELQRELKEHKEQMIKDVESLRGKIDLRSTQRFGRE